MQEVDRQSRLHHVSPSPRSLLYGWLSLVICLAFIGISSVSAGEIRTLDGKAYSGVIVALEPTEVRLRTEAGDKITTYPLKEVINLDWGTPLRPVTRVPYLRVRLVDGSQLYCLTLSMAGKNMKLMLLSGQSLEVTFDQVHTVICDAHDTASLAAFEALQADSPKQDVIRVQAREGNAIEPYEGLIQGANEQGTRLQFKARGLDTISNLDIARLRGIYFSRTGTGANDQAIARIYDTFGNCFTVTNYQWGDTACTITLQTGQKLNLLRATIARFDLTPGKLVYLSDIDPVKVEETPILSELFHYRRDKNLEGGPLSVGRRVYQKGLALHSRTVLEYDVQGHTSFRCVLGLDDAMAGTAHAIVRIEGDDKQLLATTVSSKENKPQDVFLPLTGVQKLRIIVDYGDDLDLGDHINFADARLIK